VSPQQPGPPEAVTCLPPLAEIMDELAAELGFAYAVQAADLDERALGAGAAGPAELVMLLARAKAAALQGRLEAAARPGPGGSACSAPQTAALAERAPVAWQPDAPCWAHPPNPTHHRMQTRTFDRAVARVSQDLASFAAVCCNVL